MAVDQLTPDLCVVLPLGPHAPRWARHHVAQVDKPSPDLRDATLLLTSELVSRAVECAEEGEVELRVWMPHDVVRVEMHGPCSVLEHPWDEASVYSSLVLDQIADRWELISGEDSACLWFEIDRHPVDAPGYAARIPVERSRS